MSNPEESQFDEIIKMNAVRLQTAMIDAEAVLQKSIALYADIENPVERALYACTHARLSRAAYIEDHPSYENSRNAASLANIATSQQQIAEKLSDIAESTDFITASFPNQGG